MPLKVALQQQYFMGQKYSQMVWLKPLYKTPFYKIWKRNCWSWSLKSYYRGTVTIIVRLLGFLVSKIHEVVHIGSY